ncbi:hypothetical protein SO694_00009565 [Aureococcus anophagefferens]|nr:hypothetical protein JL720_3838 [Aureococcus anophagefferens]
MALLESGQDFEYVHVDMAKGEHKSPAFLKIQPFGKVPVLQDGDFTLFESRAIMKYVLTGTPLCPGDAKEMAAVESAISVEYSYFTPAFMPVYVERMLKKKKGLEADETKVAAAIEALGPVLDVVEALLEGKTYMAGPKFTMADISYMPYFHQFDALGIAELRDDRPNLKAWWATVSTMPNWAYATSGKVATEKVAKAA